MVLPACKIIFPKLIFMLKICLLSLYISKATGFYITAPQASNRIAKRHHVITTSNSPIRSSKSPGFLFLFEDDDVSAFNTLCQFGPAPFFVRTTQSSKYWKAVYKFEKEENVSRVLAVRNMDAYFSDPIGWGLKRDREKKYGEKVDYSRKTGVQKRPAFSLFMLLLTSWFFLLFLPTRIYELGGLKPSALNGGLCPPEVRIIDENGKERFECKPKSTWPL